MTKRTAFIDELIAEIKSDEGWLSASQHGVPRYEDDGCVSFTGYGYIDLEAVASIAERVWGQK